MSPTRKTLVLLLLLACMTACGNKTELSESLDAAPLAAPAELPSSGQSDTAFPVSALPQDAARTVSGPPADYERGCSGSSASQFMPVQNFTFGSYTPNQLPGTELQKNSAAFACYVLPNMAGYTGPQTIELNWYTPPAAQDLWIGLSNYSSGRWEWLRPGADFKLEVEDFDTYVSPAENMYIYVMVLGDVDCGLNYLYAGASFIPFASIQSDLTPDILQRVAPLTVNWDSTFSQSYGGEVVAWDWDLDGDGTFEIEGDTDGLESFTYPPGAWTVRVRAINGDGASREGWLDFVAINPENLPPVVDLNASALSGEAPLLVSFDGSDSQDSDGSIVSYEWDLDGDGTFEIYSESQATMLHTFGRKGTSTIGLRVTDNDFATAVTEIDITLTSGWSDYPIDSNIRVSDSLAMTTFGTAVKRAGVAYMVTDTSDGYKTELRFSMANNAAGSTWKHWIRPVVDEEHNIGKSPQIITLVDGSPMIAYGRVHSLEPRQFVVSATDETAADWNAPVQVGGSNRIGTRSSLALINSIPAIAAQTGHAQSNNALSYYLAKNAQGTQWNDGVAVQPSVGMSFTSISLGASGSGLIKRPAIAFSRFQSSEYDLGYTTALDVDGLSWEAPVLIENVFAYQVSLGRIADRPALLVGSASQNGNLHFARADDAAGSSWPEFDQIGGGGECRLVILDGKPATCYIDGDGLGLWFVTAQDVNGSGWNEPYIVAHSSYYNSYCSLTVVDSQPVLCFTGEGETLRVAYLD